MRLKKEEILRIFKLNKLNITLIFLFILIGLLSFVYFRNGPIYLNFNEYNQILNSNKIQKAKIDGNKIYLKFDGKEYVVLKEAVNLKELYEKTRIYQKDETSFLSQMIVLFLISFLFIIILDFYLRQKKSLNASLKKAQASDNIEFSNSFKPAISNITLDDVAGISEVKDEIIEIVDFLKNPKIYKNLGINLPKGLLMAGPPGVGKTLIAKAIAGEAGVPFYYESGANFSQIYVGVGAKKVRELFANAKSNAPSIIFIDEIDAIGKSRGEGRNDEREATLNQLLTEMDGFIENSGVIVIGATNKIEMIDDALLRPGRFDRRVFISLPNYKDRIEILKIYLRGKKFDLDLSKLSRISVGFSGAGLATFVNEAMINALKRKSNVLEFDDFVKTKNKVLFGKKKELILSEKEKEIQALYQAAKAISAYWFGVEFEKINLLEDDFLKDDEEIVSKTILENRLKVYLSGLNALKIYKNDSFNNSKSDIKKALELSHKMIFEYSMGEFIVPNQNEILNILNKNEKEIKEFLSTMQKPLFEITKHLFAFETISKETIRDILKENNN